MNRFRFRLDRVRRVRALEEELARAAWREAEGAAAGAEAALGALVRERHAATLALRDRIADPRLQPLAVLAEQRGLEGLERALRAGRERARTLRFQAERARAAWSRRRVDVRALERWRERLFGEHLEREGRREARELDEAALLRSRRPGVRSGKGSGR